MIAAGIARGSLTDGSVGHPGFPAFSISSRYMRWKSPKAYWPKCIVPQAGSMSVISSARLNVSTWPSSVRR